MLGPKLVIPLVFNVNLYNFIKGNLRFLLKSRKLILKSTIIDLNSSSRTVSYGFPGFPGTPWGSPGPRGPFSEGSESYSEYSECSSE